MDVVLKYQSNYHIPHSCKNSVLIEIMDVVLKYQSNYHIPHADVSKVIFSSKKLSIQFWLLLTFEWKIHGDPGYYEIPSQVGAEPTIGRLKILVCRKEIILGT